MNAHSSTLLVQAKASTQHLARNAADICGLGRIYLEAIRGVKCGSGGSCSAAHLHFCMQTMRERCCRPVLCCHGFPVNHPLVSEETNECADNSPQRLSAFQDFQPKGHSCDCPCVAPRPPPPPLLCAPKSLQSGPFLCYSGMSKGEGNRSLIR